jgi:hypothetical protein
LSDAITHKFSDLSSVAYLEILDAQQKPVSQIKIAIENGVGKGSIFLPFSLSSGNFKIRAYTSWMKNFSREYDFEKNITIINSLQATDIKSNEKLSDFDIQFFPEGGNLIAGVECKVAFKATDEFGKGANFTATLINNLKQEVAVFEPLKFGIGNFRFKPEKGMQYKVVIKYNGKVIVKDFVAENPEAYAMQLHEIGSDIQITVAQKMDNNFPVYLLVHQGQKTTISKKVLMQNGIGKFNIDKNKIADGISYFTVFNSKMQPVCERLYFKKPIKKLLLTLKKNEKDYQTRQKVSLQIVAKDELNDDVVSNLSVSVFLSDSLPVFTEANILSYMWLKSEIKGEIENVNYYFENDDKETNQALDNLLLTQGWRKFKEVDTLKEQPLLKFEPEYQYNIITGKITFKNSDKPAPDVLTTLSVLGNTANLYGAKSDPDGNLTFYTKNINGSVKLVLQTDNLEDSLYNFTLNAPFINYKFGEQSVFSPAFIKFNTPVLNRSINMQVQNIYRSDSLKKFLKPPEQNTVFYGNASDKKYQLDQYVRFPAMEEVLREYVPEVLVKRKGNNFSLVSYNVQDKIYLDNSPLILLDGVPIKEVNRLMNYDPLKIRELDIVSKKYYLGPLVFGGILNFSSIKGDFKDFDFDPDVALIDYEGLQVQREFYAPNYEITKERTSRLPDFRTLLYWDADIKTSKTGTKQVDFYTSDLKGKYIIVLQGLSENGRVGFTQSSFQVQ